MSAILLILPVLIFAVLGNAEAERRLLIRNSVTETGNAIAAAIAPILHDLYPADLATLREHLRSFAASDRSIKVLFRPKSSATAEAFYFVATAPPISTEQTAAERQQLLRVGILPGSSQGCDARLPNGGASLLDNGSELLTSVTSVDGTAGCWAVVIATSERRVMGAIKLAPYWQRPEVRVAMAIYAVMALLIAAIFSGVWVSLLRFRRIALSPVQQADFAVTTRIPELAPVAAAFDTMVQRMRRSADMLRQAAEDNAHAFKGPIGIIRQAIALPLSATMPEGGNVRDSLRTVSAALDRLDGLVQSARYLDNAAAELLEPELSLVDLSDLVRGFVRSYATMSATRGVRLKADITEGLSVAGQPESLEAILEALIDNAISFSPAGRDVAVRLQRDANSAVISVHDVGPGVAPNRLPRIFDRYYTHRANDAATGADSHFGIGLWLARQNTVALGGEISASNGDPCGLRVTVRLPIARVSGAEGQGAPPLGTPLRA